MSALNIQPLSDSTLWQILKAIKPGLRHADGLRGFLMLSVQLNNLELDSNTASGLKKYLETLKRYLMMQYALHCSDKSNIATHCISFALFDQNDKDFQPEHDHEHNEICNDCMLLLTTLKKFRLYSGLLHNSENKDEVLYDVEQAILFILSWMKHILRGVKQEKAKAFAVQNISEHTGFWLSDWAQKILPSKYRENQCEYFGKKGMSLNVDVLFTHSNDLMKHTYFTALTTCDQDVSETLCVSDHVLKQVRADFPNITSLYQKSDNAGCYAGNAVAEIEYAICKKTHQTSSS